MHGAAKLAVLMSVSLLVGCGAEPGSGAGGGSGGGTGGGSGGAGGTQVGTPVTVSPTTATTPISTVVKCSGATLGSAADVTAMNVPVFESTTKVTALTLRYDMGTYFGEPTRKAVISWQGTGSISNLLWLAEVVDSQGKQYVTASGARVFASYQVGSIKGPGAGFGTDSTGSPSWSQTFVTYDDSAGTSFGVTDVEAKNIYKGCFKLAQLRVVKLNGKAALR